MYGNISRFRWLWLPVFLASLALSGCAAEEDDSTIEGLTIDFSIQDKFGNAATTFAAGDEIRFVFTVHNNTSSGKRLAYTHPAHSLQVRRIDDGQVVWDPHHGQMFAQVVTTVDVAAGDRLTFVETWDMQPTQELASSVPPGDYDAEPGFFMYEADANAEGELRLDADDAIRFTIQ